MTVCVINKLQVFSYFLSKQQAEDREIYRYLQIFRAFRKSHGFILLKVFSTGIIQIMRMILQWHIYTSSSGYRYVQFDNWNVKRLGNPREK